MIKNDISIVNKKVNDLIPYINNARVHSDDQINQIAASIKEFGFTNPVLIDGENGIIAGHGRVLASKKLNIDKVPTIELSHLTETQKKAYILADNKLALNAGWDDDLLSLELLNLRELDFDLDLIGFGEDELDQIIQSSVEQQEGKTDPDDVPEVTEKPKTRHGDVWLLGSHRLMCGDSTSIDEVDRLVLCEKVDVLFTDPPYGIDFKPQRGTHDKIMNDNLIDSEFDDFLDGVFGAALSVMKPDTYAFIWTGWSRIGTFEHSLKKFFKIQSLHIWVKNNFGIGYYSRPKHEPFYLCLNGKPVYPAKAPADVWEHAKVNKTVHSCEKPVDLIVSILDTYHKNSNVLDLFGGSGSTLIACEKTNRVCYMMELDTHYCDVIVNRWQNFTGKEAILESTGEAYNSIQA